MENTEEALRIDFSRKSFKKCNFPIVDSLTLGVLHNEDK